MPALPLALDLRPRVAEPHRAAARIAATDRARRRATDPPLSPADSEPPSSPHAGPGSPPLNHERRSRRLDRGSRRYIRHEAARRISPELRPESHTRQASDYYPSPSSS